ncbi:MAG: hypothetical protein INH41_13755 [Myxococcaceae bacterium]|jgi:hypothetical protein|nr:hypothetical protein [Myxococcaceae bacterium]MCA3013443.1 hypothetical protein [Myxococcaceae bacterium]
MNSVKLLGAVAATLLVTGCNTGQPRIWRVAYDTSRFVFVENSACYIGNRVPQARTQQTGYRRDANWVLWDGVTDAQGQLKQYLDIGNPTFKLGESPSVAVEDVIEGDSGKREFLATRQTQSFGPVPRRSIETRAGTVTVTWENYNPAAIGTLKVRSQYNCVDSGGGMPQDLCPRPNETPANDAANCEVSVDFVARRIDVTQGTEYGNNSGGPVAPAP